VGFDTLYFFGLSGGRFYSEVALQKREAEGTVRTKHQLNLDPNPGGTQEILDDRRIYVGIFFDCWWALFGNRPAEKQEGG